MSTYLVIARKWRPSVFEEIVGQGHVTRTLSNAVSSGRIAHAYLFSGPRGVGKTTAARILAKCLNCSQGPTPEPCNECDSCRGIASSSAVDVLEIDGASNTGVDNVRELRESVCYVPTHGRYKVYIIDEVHMLTNQAFNALLKTLEEPPPHAVFIFATTEAHKIPLTVLSRCQRFDFKRIPLRDIESHLEKILRAEGIAFEEKALFTIAREADGSLRDAQSFLDQTLSFAGVDGGEVTDAHVGDALGLMDSEVLYSLMGALVEKDAAGALNIVEKIYNFGYDLKRASADLLEVIRDLTVIKLTGQTSLLDLPENEIERLKALASCVGAERLHMIFNIASRGYEEVARSVCPRYTFEMALLKAAHFDEVRPVTELVERLEALKPVRGGSGAGASTPGGPGSLGAGRGAQGAAEPEPAYEASAPGGDAESAAGLVEHIRRTDPRLARALGPADIEIDGDAISITVDRGQVNFLQNLKGEQLNTACREFFSRPMRVSVKPAAGSGGPAAEVADRGPGRDPVVRDALRILGGRVIEARRRSDVQEPR